MAVKVPNTHGYYRALNVLVYATYFMWMGVLWAALWAIPSYFHAVGFNPFNLVMLLPRSLATIVIGIFLLVGIPSFFALAGYLNAMTAGRWIHTLSTWLYIRITLKTPVSFTDAEELMWLFVPNDTGKWYPLREVATVSRDQRHAALLARAEEIERALWPERFPPAGWYEDPEHPGLQRFWEGASWAAPAGPVPGDPQSISSRAKRLLEWGRPRWVYWAVALPILLLALSSFFSEGSDAMLSIRDDPKRVIREFKYQGLRDAQAHSLVEVLRSLGVDSISMVNVIDAKAYPSRTSDVQLGVEGGYVYVTFQGDEVELMRSDDWPLYSEGRPDPQHFWVKELGSRDRLLADARDAAAAKDEHFADLVWGSSAHVSRNGTDTVLVHGLHDVNREDENYVVRFKVWRDADGKMQKELDDIYRVWPVPGPPKPKLYPPPRNQ